MAPDQYSAVWISHTAIKDFQNCPRAYYLKHVYRDPKTGHKIKIMTPPIALGQVVHEVIEEISRLPAADRFSEPLLSRLHRLWDTVTGKKGGFWDANNELRFKQRAESMMQRLTDHPGPLRNPAVKMQGDLPHFWLSEEDNIMLCGRLDWMEYIADSESVRIIDFKTSKHDEENGSLQLPIYHLLAHYCQKRPVTGVSYWYLDRIDGLIALPIPNLVSSQNMILAIAKQIKVSRQLDRFKCPKDGCAYCAPFEAILAGKGECIGIDSFGSDIYIVPQETHTSEQESVIL